MFSADVECRNPGVFKSAYEPEGSGQRNRLGKEGHASEEGLSIEDPPGTCEEGGVRDPRGGIGGGVALAKSPEELTILDVVNAVEPIMRIRSCPLGLQCHGAALCRSIAGWTRLLESVEIIIRLIRRSPQVLAQKPSKSIPPSDGPPTPQALSTKAKVDPATMAGWSIPKPPR